MTATARWWLQVSVIGALVLGLHGSFLHRVPGLLGDEGSEGENVYELLTTEEVTLQGERSYIGPLTDYIRVPFIALLGYTTLALRIPLLITSVVVCLLVVSISQRLWGHQAAPLILVSATLNPIYLTAQRLGWAITYLPLCALVLVWLLTRPATRPRALLVGIAAGIGLHVHILFAPIAAGIVVASTGYALCQWWIQYRQNTARSLSHILHQVRVLVSTWWPAIIGFWAAFATQFAVLRSSTADQGQPAQVAQLFAERWHDLPQVLPLVISGSAYIAEYTGQELSPSVTLAITTAVAVLASSALIVGPRRLLNRWWAVGLTVALVVLTIMIDRFSLRYFEVIVLGLWILAGVGTAQLLTWAASKVKHAWFTPAVTGSIATLATVVFISNVLLPFLQTGGSTASFSLGNRTGSASALVSTTELFTCLHHAGTVAADNVHIFNRLQYHSHADPTITVLPEESDPSEAQWLVRYRGPDSDTAPTPERCPALKHWQVLAVRGAE